ncbi:uncharacterized protein [Chironomus tepperi]|uniref:uncharacterized protein n=1 Tax=Chironomus tepperi TaxID=113505 RepID=UPI00391FA4B5
MDQKDSNSRGSTNPILPKKKLSSKAIAWIISGVICAVSLITAASVSTYFILKNKSSESGTTKGTIETTTSSETPLYYINRDIWGANPPKSNSIPKLELPLRRIIIGHTGGSFCTTQTECISVVKSIQIQDAALDDIPYNFLIGGDGNVYEGRGFNFTGQHTQNLESTDYNSIGICIAFIGNYQSIAPSVDQISLLSDFIRTSKNRGLIVADHIIVSQDDLKYFPIKAEMLNNAIKSLQNYRPLYKIYRREEWEAEKPHAKLDYYQETMNWVLIGHTVSQQCNDLNDCKAVVKAIQNDAFSRNPPLSDILYNIIIGGDGLVFEGRGWDIVGAHTTRYNDKTIGIGVIGDFSSIPPNQNILNAMVQVLDDAMELGKLTEDYKIFGRSDFGLAGPGDAFMNIIKTFCRYGNRTSACGQDTTIEYSTTSKLETSTVIRTTISYPTVPSYLVLRHAWGADPPKSNSIPMLKLPIERIIIGHTLGASCMNEVDCISAVKSIQTQDPSLDDIAFNFLIGGDNNIYEGRGFYYQGQHTQNVDATEYNSIGICIAFIGDYSTEEPTESQINLLNNFIRTFIEYEIIAEDHIVVSQDDLKYFETKASALNRVVATIENFRPLYKIYRREEWMAERQTSELIPFTRTMDWVLIGHSVTPLCNDLSACKSRARSLQNFDFSRGLSDILYNIFFGGDGFAFEGRGWDVLGAHHSGLNDKTIATGVIGDFTNTAPNDNILNAILRVLDDAMALGKLTKDYKIFGRSDFDGPGPGEAFMKKIREWCRYGNRTTECNISTTSTPTTLASTTSTTNFEATTPYEVTTPFEETTEPSTTEYPLIFNLVTRKQWGAQPPRSSNISKLDLPIKRIIIGHTGGEFCTNQNDCINMVKSIQTQDSSLDDIAYNFLIGGDGRIYEGRGFKYQGQHTENLDATEYNSIGICIAFIGNYTSIAPSSELIDSLTEFISNLIELDILIEDHIIVHQDDLKYFESKADALNNVIKSLANFRPLYKIYRREEWMAERQTSELIPFTRTMDWVLIGHSVTPLCTDLTSCKSRARSMQNYDFSRGLSDILYNIFFGGDGFAFEGRGWDVRGALHSGLNDKSITNGVIGDFTNTAPNDNILNAILRVLDDAMALGKLTDDYKIFGRSDFGGPGPGEAFMTKIREWCRYGNRTTSC